MTELAGLPRSGDDDVGKPAHYRARLGGPPRHAELGGRHSGGRHENPRFGRDGLKMQAGRADRRPDEGDVGAAGPVQEGAASGSQGRSAAGAVEQLHAHSVLKLPGQRND